MIVRRLSLILVTFLLLIVGIPARADAAATLGISRTVPGSMAAMKIAAVPASMIQATGTPSGAPTTTSTPTATPTTPLTPTATPTLPPVPSLALSSTTGSPGGLLGVSGTGFFPNAAITVSIAGQFAASDSGTAVVTSSSGSFSAIVIIPPSGASGYVSVTATDGFHTLTQPFLLVAGAAAGITIAPSSGAAGSTVQVLGSGFTANAPISIVVGSTVAQVYGGSVVFSSASGTFAAIITVPPALPVGATSITASDSTHVATAGFQITGTASAYGTGAVIVSPTQGPPGTGITLQTPAGSLPAGAAAIVSFQPHAGSPVAITAGATVNASGSISLSLTMPAAVVGGPGTITVTAGSASLSTAFTVQPALQIQPSQVQPGQAVILSGVGFSASGTVNVTIGGLSASIATGASLQSNVTGSFGGSVLVPAGVPAGPAGVTASDGTNSAASSLTVLAPLATAVPPTLVPAPTAATILSTPAPLPTLTPISLAPSQPYSTAPTATPPSSAVPQMPVHTTTTYFAAGNTDQAATTDSATSSEYLELLNPGPLPAAVTIVYLIQGSHLALTVHKTVPASSLLNESVNSDVGANKTVAAAVIAPSDVFASRTLLRHTAKGLQLEGSSTAGVRSPSTAWYFALDSAGGSSQEDLSIVNPAAKTAQLVLRLAGATGHTPARRTLSLTSGAVTTVSLGGVPAGRVLGVALTSDQSVVAEVTQYYGPGKGAGTYGATVSPGLSHAGTQVTLPIDLAGTSAAQVLVFNPRTSGAPTKLVVRVLNASNHQLAQKTLTVARLSTVALSAGALVPHASGPLLVAIQATTAVVAEAELYYGGAPAKGTAAAVITPGLSGPAAPATLVGMDTVLPNGTALARSLMIVNPGHSTLDVVATYFDSVGDMVYGSYAVGAGRTVTVNVNHDARGLHQGALAVQLVVGGDAGGLFAYSIGAGAKSHLVVGMQDGSMSP